MFVKAPCFFWPLPRQRRSVLLLGEVLVTPCSTIVSPGPLESLGDDVNDRDGFGFSPGSTILLSPPLISFRLALGSRKFLLLDDEEFFFGRSPSSYPSPQRISERLPAFISQILRQFALTFPSLVKVLATERDVPSFLVPMTRSASHAFHRSLAAQWPLIRT